MGHSIEGLFNWVAIDGTNPKKPTINRPPDQAVVRIAGENSKKPLEIHGGSLTLSVFEVLFNKLYKAITEEIKEK